MTIANQCTGEQNHLFPFLMKKFKPIKIALIFSICIYFLTQKNSLFTSDIHYLWNGIDFESVILVKFIHYYINSSLPNKLESRIFTKWIGLSEFIILVFLNSLVKF